ncbi:BnaA08g28490D [Brassica napus]|uniref:BnaA08g28490D protein n=1 Tax=Brassica napus TaxID=3708 RepID=A0A078FMC6_BRANA|nr:BnaA08g28490D [Brassica napus]
MDDSLYDEFGNYIGPEIESDRESDDEIEDSEFQDKHPEEDGSDGEQPPGGSNGWITTINDVEMDNQIVLPEDKKYYPTAEEVYGEDVETRQIRGRGEGFYYLRVDAVSRRSYV